jgi:hypothetical protein
VKKSISLFPSHTTFIVCSDDIKWTKKFFSLFQGNFYFIEGEKYFIDFYLLSMCKNVIISNSSFSWWAAYLNSNENKVVIAPVPYAFDRNRKLNDTYPPDWILINREEDNLIPDYETDNIYQKTCLK